MFYVLEFPHFGPSLLSPLRILAFFFTFHCSFVLALSMSVHKFFVHMYLPVLACANFEHLFYFSCTYSMNEGRACLCFVIYKKCLLILSIRLLLSLVI